MKHIERALAVLLATFMGIAAAQSPGPTLVVGSTQAVRHFNPAVQSGAATASLGGQLFAGLVRLDEHWQPQPYLAQSWTTSEDGLTVTFKLRTDAVFHDLQPITSKDVAFSILATKAHHPFVSMLAPVTAVESPRPDVVTVRLRHPHAALFQALSPGFTPIMPQHIYDDGRDLRTHPRNHTNVVGSGPLRLVEFKQGEHVIMEAFDRFFIPLRSRVHRVVVRYSADPLPLILAMERKEVHCMPFTSDSHLLKRFAANPALKIHKQGYAGIGALNWLAFNLEHPILKDVRVRRAIAHAIDKRYITGTLHAGMSTASNGPIVASHPMATRDLSVYPLDLLKAASLLDEAKLGVKGPNGERFSLRMDYIPGVDDQQRNIAEYIAAQLRKIGIRVEMRHAPDFIAWAGQMGKRDFDLSMDMVFNWGDPVIGVHRTYLSSNIRPLVWSNTQSYRNAEVDQLLEAAAVEKNVEKRKVLYARFQQAVTADLPVLFINEIPFSTVCNSDVRGVPASVLGAIEPWDSVELVDR